MALDNAQFISELSPSDPTFKDLLGEADDHLRTVKRATQQSFPNIDKEVTTTADELNFVDGVTSSIQTQIDDANASKAPIANPVFTGDISIGDATVDEAELEILDGATITTDELNFSAGLTANIQAQFNGIVLSPDSRQWQKVANSAFDNLRDIDFSAGSILDSTGANIITTINLTKQLDALWVAGDNVGGRFAGSLIANKTYHLFSIKNTTTLASDVGFSEFINASDRPAGFDVYRRIASLYTDGSSNLLQFTQYGDDFYLNTPVVHYDDTTPGLSAVPVPAAVPADITVNVQITVKTHFINNTATIITSLAGDDIAPDQNVLSNLRTAPDVFNASVVMEVNTNTSREYRSRTSTNGTFSTFLQFTMRWTDDRSQ